MSSDTPNTPPDTGAGRDFSNHPRLADLDRQAAPAFVVGKEGDVLWTNPPGHSLLSQAMLGAMPDDEPGEMIARQITGFASQLAEGSARLVRLRLPAPGRPPHVTCRAEIFEDGAILISALDASTAPLPEPGGNGQAPAEDAPTVLPLRFTWQSDEAGSITLVTPEPADALGLRMAPLAGTGWSDITGRLPREPGERLRRALERHDTWSGIVLDWPVEDGRSIAIELAGLPMFDRERAFKGFRGFGVVRTVPEALPAPDQNEQRPPLPQDDRSTLQEIARAIEDFATAPPPAIAEPAGGDDVAGEMAAARHAAERLAILHALPSPILIHRLGLPVFANQAFLDLVGADDIDALAARGLEALFDEAPQGSAACGLTLSTFDGRRLALDGTLKTIEWEGARASLMALRDPAPAAAAVDQARLEATEHAAEAAEQRARELASILDTTADGVVMLDGIGRVLSMNPSAEALFGYESAEIEGRAFTLLLAAESHRTAQDYLEGLRANGLASALNDGRDVTGVVRRGGKVPLFMTLGRVGEAREPRFCAVLRDVTHVRKAERELQQAKTLAERASIHKAEFLARVSHEIRTPLNAIIGFAEMMMAERFGPIGNDRYRDYLRDIHASGSHVVRLVDDLLDLSSIEAGRFDLTFAPLVLNDIVQEAVAAVQEQAAHGRIIIRASLAPNLPQIVADARSLRQAVVNILSNALAFTPPGGQVIVSTALSDLGRTVIRIRDTGTGMSPADIATALEPFRQLPTTAGTRGAGTCLPLTRALAEANRASFSIESAAGSGTLVELGFPPAAAHSAA